MHGALPRSEGVSFVLREDCDVLRDRLIPQTFDLFTLFVDSGMGVSPEVGFAIIGLCSDGKAHGRSGRRYTNTNLCFWDSVFSLVSPGRARGASFAVLPPT